jgi:hypothetical protein
MVHCARCKRLPHHLLVHCARRQHANCQKRAQLGAVVYTNSFCALILVVVKGWSSPTIFRFSVQVVPQPIQTSLLTCKMCLHHSLRITVLQCLFFVEPYTPDNRLHLHCSSHPFHSGTSDAIQMPNHPRLVRIRRVYAAWTFGCWHHLHEVCW